MATIKATYRQYNEKTQSWDDVHFKTHSSLVSERKAVYNSGGELTTSSLYFLRPETHTINNKTFFSNNNHQGITLYGTDIKLDGYSDAMTIAEKFNQIDGDYLKLTNIETPTSWSNFVGNDIARDSSVVLSGAGVKNILDDYTAFISTADTSKAGLMSTTDKSRLDKMWGLWNADSGDKENNIVDKITELLDVFDTYAENVDIVTYMNNKFWNPISLDDLQSNANDRTNSGISVRALVDYFATKEHLKNYAELNKSVSFSQLNVTGSAGITEGGKQLSQKYVNIDKVTTATDYGSFIQNGDAQNTNMVVSGATLGGVLKVYTKVFTGSTTPADANVKTGDIWIFSE
jgi:hypothetical protein